MNFAMIFIGGGLGAVVRYILSLVIPKMVFPLYTLAANFIGCFIASAVITFFVLKSNFNTTFKLLIITGFCGGLTTLSTLSLEVMEFIQTGSYLKACTYIFTSLLICAISVILGIVLVRKYV